MMSVQGFLVYSIICLSVLGSVYASGYRHSDFDGRYHSSPGRRVVTRVRYDEPAERNIHVTHEVHHVVHKKRKRLRPVAVVPVEPIHPVSGFEGSYVAVSGDPGRGSVHVVENVPALGANSVTVVNGVRYSNTPVVAVHPQSHHVALAPVHRVPPPVPHPGVQGQFIPNVNPIPPRGSTDGVSGDRLPLPKCSYVNTDFPGDDLDVYGDDDDDDNNNNDDRRKGVNAGSARACKARCRLEEDCSFWSYREGFNRDINVKDCFLKRGTPGLPVPREAVPRIGFVSGTKDNNCVCIMSDDEEDEVCPLKNPEGLVYPWRSTDQEEEDIAKGLLPSGWSRAGGEPYYPGLGSDPGYPGTDGTLQGDIQSLRAQLDVLTRRLENQ